MHDLPNLAHALTMLLRLMVDNPGNVRVDTIEVANTITFKVGVATEDIGKVIGKQGRTAHSLRQILQAISMTSGQKIYLDIAEFSLSSAVKTAPEPSFRSPDTGDAERISKLAMPCA